jgi:hypothetical protein
MSDRDFTKTSWNYDCDRSPSSSLPYQSKTAQIRIAKQNQKNRTTHHRGVHRFASGKLLAKEQSQLFETSVVRLGRAKRLTGVFMFEHGLRILVLAVGGLSVGGTEVRSQNHR